MRAPAVAIITFLTLQAALAAAPDRDANHYISAIEKINATHARNLAGKTEEDLAEQLPRTAANGLEKVLKADPDSEILIKCGEAALDLARMDDFEKIRARLLESDKVAAEKLGDAIARKRFLVRGIGAFEEGFLEDFADLTDAILDAYDEVFGFNEWSKVPGKKIRIRVHLVDSIKRPPHFAPQFPYHSEIDMPCTDPKQFASPTARGQMMFYGLCHELGHLIAMWGDRRTQEDHHAWAHYTGVVIVEHMSKNPKYEKLLEKRRDVRWRSLSLEKRKDENQVAPSTKNKPAVMSLLIKLHEIAGTKNIGTALNRMDEKGVGSRVNHVRYYTFKDLKKALGAVIEDREKRRTVEELFP